MSMRGLFLTKDGMGRTHRGLMLALVILFSVTTVAAQSIGVSPSESGQLNPRINWFWDYSGPWGASIRLDSVSSAEVDREPPSEDLEKSITTVDQKIAIEAIPINYGLALGSITLRPGIGLQYDFFDIQEVGFQDISLSNSEYRLFFNNARKIHALRPGVSTALTTKGEVFSANLQAFFSPWFYISLDQELSSATAPNLDSLNTEVTGKKFTGSGTGAWGAFLDLTLNTDLVNVSLQSSWEGYSLAYDFIQIGGATGSLDLTNITGTVDALIGIGAIDFNGLSPLIGLGLGWDWVKVNGSEDAQWNRSDLPVRFTFGLSASD